MHKLIMIRVRFYTLLIITGLSISACTGTADSPESARTTDSFLIKNVRVFDGEKIHANTNVLVQKGLISAVGTAVSNENVAHIDGSGHTLMPGFLDAHTHTENTGQLQQALSFGVTTVFDMGTFAEYDKMLREAAASRADVADFRSSGIAITPSGGHFTEYGYDIPTLDKVSETDKFVQDRVNEGADYLKVVINGVRHEKNGWPTLDEETVNAVVEAGHEHGLLVLAHVESEADVRLAVSAGVDGLVHYWRDSGARPDLATLIKSNDVFVVAGDVTVIDGFVNEGPQAIINDVDLGPYLSVPAREQLTKHVELPPGLTIQATMEGLRSLIEAEVFMLAGTDAFNGNPRIVHGASFHRMLELFVEAGLSPTEALRMATANVADTFKIADRGRIKAGLRADMLMVHGDPSRNILATRKIVRVWRAGVEYFREKQ